jgi:hypothetical protein
MVWPQKVCLLRVFCGVVRCLVRVSLFFCFRQNNTGTVLCFEFMTSLELFHIPCRILDPDPVGQCHSTVCFIYLYFCVYMRVCVCVCARARARVYLLQDNCISLVLIHTITLTSIFSLFIYMLIQIRDYFEIYPASTSTCSVYRLGNFVLQTVHFWEIFLVRARTNTYHTHRIQPPSDSTLPQRSRFI